MLLSMQQLASTALQPHPRRFAELLADLAVPAKKPPQCDLDGLEDDVATFSYEQALRTGPLQPVACVKPVPAQAPAQGPAPERRSPVNPAGSQQGARKAASVTVRFSALEATQLRLRAAEAGLTVSAYLRSCAFEIESLRAQVKSALAEIRLAPVAPQATQDEHQPVRRTPWLQLVTKLFGRPKRSQTPSVNPLPTPGISDTQSPGY